MALMGSFLDWLARRITSSVICSADPERTPIHTDVERLARVLQPGDVLLVDGCDKVAAAIRYLTQSSWSHAAMYVGPHSELPVTDGEPHTLVEVLLANGCVSAPLSKYRHYATRICRPAALTPADRHALVRFMISRIGHTYDTRNIVDLARYLIPHPPVPKRWRRQMLALGSGEPTRAICSSMIAAAFQSIRYPILPIAERTVAARGGASGYSIEEILHIRHHSLFVPRDFDLSPYFEVVKPTLAEGFNYKGVHWADHHPPQAREAARPDPARTG
jgi:hypothetical protein